MEFDGELISELGAKKYLQGHKAQAFSSIKPLQRQEQIEQQWQACNFGCHAPSYRVLRKNQTRSEFLASLNKVSPVAAGLAAGVEHQTTHQLDVAGAGIKRTAEGLGVTGSEKFSQVGEENIAVFNLVRVSAQSLLNVDIQMLENPLFKLVLGIVYEYVKLIPEWVIIKAVNGGALHFPDAINKQLLAKAASQGLIEAQMLKHIDAAYQALEAKAIPAVSKQAGKEIAKAIAAMVAAKVAQKIMLSAAMDYATKKRLAALRKSFRSAKGGAATTLVLLLKANGLLGISARASRELQRDCPALWRVLRYQCNGLDMLLFLVRDCVKEYLDRI
ncbi:MAG TPA: cellulose-binding protein, partial [Marinagarivorans sp.]